MPKLRKLPLFLVASALLIVALVVVNGIFTARFFERQAVQHEERVTVEMVRSQVAQHLTPGDFAGEPGAGSAFDTFFTGLPGVFRMKIFEPGGRIVWSNDQRLIGSSFPDNPSLRAAVAGRVVTKISAPTLREHLYERTTPAIAEVYVPYYDPAGRLVAVVETYKDMTGLMRDITTTRRQVWAVTASLGMLLWTALALVVRRASRNERRAIMRLTEQNRAVSGLQDFTRSLLQPLDVTAVGRSMAATGAAELRAHRVALYRRPAAGGSTAVVAAWPGDRPPVPPSTGVPSAGRHAIVDDTIVATLAAGHDDAYVFVAELDHPVGDADIAMLDIMLNEAAVALKNAALYTQVREAHERLAAILSGVTDRMLIIDRDMRVVWMNPTEDPDGVGAEALGYECFMVFGGTAHVCAECPAERTFRTGRVERGVRRQPTPSGPPRYLDLLAAPLRDSAGRVDRVLEVARDITEMVEMEERVKVAAARLEESNAALVVKADELERSNRALCDAQQQLVEKERLAAVGELIVGLHHSILNPLTGILGACQIMKQDQGLSATTQEALAAAAEEVRKIEAIVRRLPSLRRVAGTPYVAGTTMLDLGRSCDDEAS